MYNVHSISYTYFLLNIEKKIHTEIIPTRKNYNKLNYTRKREIILFYQNKI